MGLETKTKSQNSMTGVMHHEWDVCYELYM